MLRIYKYILFIYLIFPPYILLGQGNPSTKAELQEEYGNLENIPKESVEQSTSDDIIIKNVNNSYYSKDVMDDGYTHAILTGNVHIIYSGYDIYADEMIIKILGGKPKVLIAKGNVLLKNNVRTTVAMQIFVYLDNHDIQILDPVTLQNNIYLRGSGIRFNHNDLVHLENISMTTSLRYLPRYSLNATSGWVEQDNDFILVNAYLQIGQDPIFYFPVFYNNHYGTGIITNVSYDAYLGFIVANTLEQKTPVSSDTFMLDYYEKLGVYTGNDYSRTDIGNLDTHIGLAYDYHAQYADGYVNNVFEQVLGEGATSGRSLRYNLGLDYDKYIFKSDDPNGLIIRYKGSFKELSDPDFISQFETNRSSQFDPKGILFSDNTGYSRVQSGTAQGTEGRRIDNSIQLGMNGYSLQIASSYVYALNPGNKTKNTFDADYWKNTPSSQVIPKLTFNKSFLIYTVDKNMGANSSLTMPIKFDIYYNFQNSTKFEAEGLSNKDILNNIQTIISAAFTYKIGPKFTLNIPFSLDNTYKYDSLQYYSYATTGNLSSSIEKGINTLKAIYTPTMTINMLDDLTLTNINTLTTSFISNTYKTTFNGSSTTTTNNNDNINTYNNLTQIAGESLKLGWVNDWDYLSGYVLGAYTYTYDKKDGKVLPVSSWTKARTHNISLEANFFETTIGVSSSNKYGTNITAENRINPVAITLESTMIPYVTISNAYTWSRYYNQGTDNTFSLVASVPSRVNIASWLWFNSVDISINWTSDLTNPILDLLSYKFSLIFNITELWQLSFGLSGQNQRLYLYGNSASVGEKTNFFIDLLKSFAIWSTRLRQESNFKMNDLDIVLSHDLDEWVLKAGVSLEPKSTSSGKFYFNSQFYIEVILKDLGMLSAPRMAQGNDDEDI